MKLNIPELSAQKAKTNRAWGNLCQIISKKQHMQPQETLLQIAWSASYPRGGSRLLYPSFISCNWLLWLLPMLIFICKTKSRSSKSYHCMLVHHTPTPQRPKSYYGAVSSSHTRTCNISDHLPSPCMSDVQRVRLSRSSCMMSVESL